MPLNNPIRDLREQKNLSQDAVAAAAGLTYSVFYRIEAGTGKTTQDEVDKVVKVLKKMKAGTRKLAGRPFGDPKVQAAVAKARQEGKSVAQILAKATPAPAKKTTPAKTTPAKKATPAKKTTPAKATPAKKATAKKATPAKKTTPAPASDLI